GSDLGPQHLLQASTLIPQRPAACCVQTGLGVAHQYVSALVETGWTESPDPVRLVVIGKPRDADEVESSTVKPDLEAASGVTQGDAVVADDCADAIAVPGLMEDSMALLGDATSGRW
ncbi:MAG: hypothetical protein ACKPKO_40415, partial [Candidatus Fonsibacter sp.]